MFGKFNEKAYVVGGCIRDKLMNLPTNDVDFVVEATRDEFEKTFPDLSTVGKDFPVYLMRGCEVAMTRVETSTGDGYGDFTVEETGVPILDDLGRRDFTINSIAQHYTSGEYVDPFDGISDIENQLIRTVFPKAFEEDPVRILRGARFAARFGFNIEEKTTDLMNENVHRLQHVTKERIVLELEKAYKQCDEISRYFRILRNIRALPYIMKPLDDCAGVPAGPKAFHGNNTAFDHIMEAIDRCKDNGFTFDTFMGVLCHDWGKATTDPEIFPHHYGHENRSHDIVSEWLEDMPFRKQTKEIMLLGAKYHMKMRSLKKMKTLKKVRFVKAVKKYFYRFNAICYCDHPFDFETQAILNIVKHTIQNTKFTTEEMKNVKDPAQYVERRQVRETAIKLKEYYESLDN